MRKIFTSFFVLSALATVAHGIGSPIVLDTTQPSPSLTRIEAWQGAPLTIIPTIRQGGTLYTNAATVKFQYGSNLTALAYGSVTGTLTGGTATLTTPAIGITGRCVYVASITEGSVTTVLGTGVLNVTPTTSQGAWPALPGVTFPEADPVFVAWSTSAAFTSAVRTAQAAAILPAGAVTATNQGVAGQSLFFSQGSPSITNVGYWATVAGSGDMLKSEYDAGGAKQVVFTNDPRYQLALTNAAAFDTAGTAAAVGTASSNYTDGVIITGGTGYTVTNYFDGGTNWTAYIFTNNPAVSPTPTNTFTLLRPRIVDILVVGGGGFGGRLTDASIGGGGAGGLLYVTCTNLVSSSYSVVVGQGEEDSVFGAMIAASGGTASTGGNGGSGAGSIDATVHTGIAGQGNNGGTGTGNDTATGGGGGAGAVGGNAPVSGTGGVGGDGRQISISGIATWYAGGGGGGATAVGGAGGLGGGGAGAVGANDPGDGVNGTGGGGGGGQIRRGSGGSGIVIIRLANYALIDMSTYLTKTGSGASLTGITAAQVSGAVPTNDTRYLAALTNFTDLIHGARGGANLHALADGSGAGFMSALQYGQVASMAGRSNDWNAAAAHTNRTDNPHAVTVAQVSGAVSNTPAGIAAAGGACITSGSAATNFWAGTSAAFSALATTNASTVYLVY